jgi:predicted RecA/RadA family phage recombinase
MATQYKHNGHRITYTSTAAITSGQLLVLTGGLGNYGTNTGQFGVCGIAITDIAADDTVGGAVAMDGVWTVTANAAANESGVVGAPVYFYNTSSNKATLVTAGTNTAYAGVLATAKPSTATTTLDVLLNR